MAISATCSLNLPTPPSTSLPQSPNSSTKPDRIAWNMKVSSSWRKQCAVAGIAACMIISTDMLPLFGSDQSNSIALAENMQTHLVESKRSVGRWSDKRACPPWISNQLEIVVPENLPRPSAHRRSESVTLSKLKERSSNQVIRLALRNGNGCFTM
ncbi:hypothetical protein ACHQM5_002401 [Ranunculus cassubicifolius]